MPRGSGCRKWCGSKIADIDSSRMLIRVEQGKGGQRPLRHAVAAAARRAARLLAEARPAHWLFPGPGRQAGRSIRACCSGLPQRAGGGQARQAGHRPYAAPQLRHPSARSRHRHPHHPGAARPSRPVDDGPLHAGRRHDDRQHCQPVRPAEAWRNAARPDPRQSCPPWRWRTSSAAMASLSPGACRPPRPRRAAHHGGDRGCAAPRRWAATSSAAPNCGTIRIAYNSCRNRHCPKCQGAARAAWLAERQAELLPVPYFHVVFTLPAAAAEIAFQNKAAGLRHPVQGGGRDAAHDRRRSAPSRRRDRLRRRAAHLGPEPAAPSARPLPRPRRRPVAGRHALGLLPARLLSAGAGAVAACSAGCSWKSCGPPSMPAGWRSSAHSPGLPTPASSPAAWPSCGAVEWVVYAKRPFAGPAAMCWPISAATRTASRSPTAGLSRSPTAGSASAGATTGITTRTRS